MLSLFFLLLLSCACVLLFPVLFACFCLVAVGFTPFPLLFTPHHALPLIQICPALFPGWWSECIGKNSWYMLNDSTCFMDVYYFLHRTAISVYCDILYFKPCYLCFFFFFFLVLVCYCSLSFLPVFVWLPLASHHSHCCLLPTTLFRSYRYALPYFQGGGVSVLVKTVG